MKAYEQVREILKEMSGQDRIITIPKIYIEMTGGLTESLVLNQIVFYSDKSKREDGFFYKTYSEWAEETSLTERQVRHATKKLKDKELIDTKVIKANGAPTVHYKFRFDNFVKWILTKRQNGSLHNVSIDTDKMSESLTYDNSFDLLTDDTDIQDGPPSRPQKSENPKKREKDQTPNVMDAFLNAFGKMPNGIQLDHLNGFLNEDKMDPAVIVAVMEKAALGGKPFNYVTAALAGLCREGVTTEEAYRANEKKRRGQHGTATAQAAQNDRGRNGTTQKDDRVPGFVNRSFDDVDISAYTKKGL